MSLNSHQQELRHAYVRGGPGAIISGGVWFAAALTAMYSSISDAFYVLFFAGMFIFPASKLALKLFFGDTRPLGGPDDTKFGLPSKISRWTSFLAKIPWIICEWTW